MRRDLEVDRVFPELMSADDVAAWLCTTRKAVYSRRARGQLPAPISINRRLLWERKALATWLEQKRVASLDGDQRSR